MPNLPRARNEDKALIPGSLPPETDVDPKASGARKRSGSNDGPETGADAPVDGS